LLVLRTLNTQETNHMKRRLSYLAAITCCSALAAGAQAQSTVTLLVVAEHIDNVDIDDLTYDQGFSQATTALTGDQGADDIACNLTLGRNQNEPVYYWWGTDNNISTKAEYETFQSTADNVPAYMFVFNDITWCNGTGAVGGCGWPIGGRKPFAVTRSRAASAARGIVYAHEFGHTAGLSHDETGGNQIMDGDFLETWMTGVRNSTACNGFRNNNFGSNCASGVCSGATPARAASGGGDSAADSSAASPAASKLSIAELARQPIIDRIPVEVGDSYGQADAEVLRKMLLDPAEAEHHRTIVTLLGLISNGAAEDVAAIEASIATGEPNVSAGSFALGYIVNRTNNKTAMDALLRGQNSENVRLAQASVLGLGLTGKPAALAKLQGLRGTQKAAALKRGVLDQALEDVSVIASSGLRGYYSRKVEPSPASVTLGQTVAGRPR
jgi:hypothetical protein